MSFSGDIKQELVKQFSKSRHCQLAELAGILEMTGSIHGNPLILQLNSENSFLMEKYAILMRRAFSLDISKTIEREDTIGILKAMKWYEPDVEKQLPLQQRKANDLLLQKVCCRRAFIRGAFLAAGSISDPNKSYHFEIVCKTPEQAEQLRNLINSFEAEAKIVERKGHYIVYLKEGAQIVDMLNVMEAYVSLMKLENVRILKEVRNTVNRKVNCETANLNKTVNASLKQVEDIELILERQGLKSLPENLQEMAIVRLENPDASLKELGELLNPPVGKSGVNHRLRKLAEIAEKLK